MQLLKEIGFIPGEYIICGAKVLPDEETDHRPSQGCEVRRAASPENDYHDQRQQSIDGFDAESANNSKQLLVLRRMAKWQLQSLTGGRDESLKQPSLRSINAADPLLYPATNVSYIFNTYFSMEVFCQSLDTLEVL
ncbi:MAG: hypothetical protein AMJ65_13825 [Phycisphaerae bacterium SG8_4]|nr:MAG: hypothetical protein AMJ65_13825 [Phycisphaerae bacterium SG8_4]